MPPVVFEPAIPGRERPYPHALDRTATGIGQYSGCFHGLFLMYPFTQNLEFILSILTLILLTWRIC